jgi:two-component system response regulator DesR
VLRLAEFDTPVAVIAKQTHLSNGTVRNYIAAVINKLGVTTRSEAVRTARENDWL